MARGAGPLIFITMRYCKFTPEQSMACSSISWGLAKAIVPVYSIQLGARKRKKLSVERPFLG